MNGWSAERMLAVRPLVAHNYGMWLTRREWPILLINVVYIVVFSAVALREVNIEFLLYTGVILAVMGWILVKQQSIRFDAPILWGLTLWGMMHLAGGNIRVGDHTLYAQELIRLAPRFHILRFDQLVHTFGFGVATLLCHHLLRSHLRDGITRWGTLSLLLVLMGSGLGAINEIIEFIAVQTVPETGVGGYDNTMLDMVFNLLGGILAVTWLAWRRRTPVVVQ